jgi:hypothetical protein
MGSWGIRAALTAAIAAAAMVALPAAASAADRYASPAGVGGEPCAVGDPCPLELAVEGAGTNDQVILAGGVPPAAPFVAPPNIIVPNDVVVRGAVGVRPMIIFGDGPGFGLGSNSVLRDLEVEYTGDSAAIQFNNGASPGVIERVVAHALDGAEPQAARAPCFALGDAVIRDSVCWYDTDSPQAGAIEGRALSGTENHTVTVRNSTAISTPTTPAGQDEPAILGHAQSGGVVTINVTNSIASSEAGPDVSGFVVGGTVTIALDHSNYATEAAIVEPASITDPGTGTNQTAAPAFVNAAAGDFHQTASSAGTLNLGTATGLLVGELDLDGLARSQDTAPDIGAYEMPFVAPPPPGGASPTPPATKKKKKCKKKKRSAAAAKKKKCKKKRKK